MPNDKIKDLTLKEKASMLVGHSNMSTFGVLKKGVKPIEMSDGPSGLRLENPNGNSLNQVSNALPATCFPVEITLASTWNCDLAHKMGVAMGEECVSFGVNVLLGPAVNIQRNPLCGRNFEYFTEDPFLAGKLGLNIVKGVQSQGVGACVKHYACNNLEKYRYTGDSIVDKRALHEIYLKQFEMIVKESDPRAIMTAYNQINGTFASEHKYLIEDVLRKSWGFDGIVMTDWGGMVHRDIALQNGCDLEMPGSVDYNVKLIHDSVINGTLSEDVVNKSVERLLDCRERTDIKEKKECNFEDHYQVALSIALEGATLLKNNNNVLPLSLEKKYLVIGGLFDSMRYQGAGSSMLNPALLIDHKKAFENAKVKYDFVMGYLESEVEPNEVLEQEALDKAKNFDTIVFYGGLNDYVESEGFDRDDMKIPNNQLSLLDKLSKLGKKIVLVLFGGAPVEMPFFDAVDSILYMLLPGEAGGEATTKLLFGEVNPSGKLSQTWPLAYNDIPFADEFASSPYEVYKESIFVGYRYFNIVKKQVRFPFGFGLSYTNFEYSKLTLKQEKDGFFARIFVKNTGNLKGKETVQLYISKTDSNIVRPSLELKGFSKIELGPGEEKEVSIFVKNDLLGVYYNDNFVIEGGEYQIFVGPNSNDFPLKSCLVIQGEKLEKTDYDILYEQFLSSGNINKENYEKLIDRTIPNYEFGKKPYTFETPIGELNTFFGRIFKNTTIGIGKKTYKRALKIKDPLIRERQKKAGIFIMKLMPNNSFRSLCFSSSGLFKYSLAKGVLELSNGHIFRGIKEMCKSYKIKEKK